MEKLIEVAKEIAAKLSQEKDEVLSVLYELSVTKPEIEISQANTKTLIKIVCRELGINRYLKTENIQLDSPLVTQDESIDESTHKQSITTQDDIFLCYEDEDMIYLRDTLKMPWDEVASLTRENLVVLSQRKKITTNLIKPSQYRGLLNETLEVQWLLI